VSHVPPFFDTLVQDNLRARYVQDISSFEYSVRLEELTGFFRDQRWMHMHDVLRGLGITFHELGRQGQAAARASLEAITFQELGHQGHKGAIASLMAEGISWKEASKEFASRGLRGALSSLEAHGYTGERAAFTELGHRGRDGALASLEAQGYTVERAALTELSRRGGEAKSAIYRISGSCTYPGCTLAINSGEFCKRHHPTKPVVEKSDKCRNCGRVFGAKEQVRGGVCCSCYHKPEAVAVRKKATAEKKKARGTCSTPGCKSINSRGLDKCVACMYPGKSK
jgi:hypothetical protein